MGVIHPKILQLGDHDNGDCQLVKQQIADIALAGCSQRSQIGGHEKPPQMGRVARHSGVSRWGNQSIGRFQPNHCSDK
jgi:hypothetical protein